MKRLPVSTLALLSLVLAAWIPFSVSLRAGDVFLEVDGIKGDSVQVGHAGQIELDSFNLSMFNRGEFTLVVNKPIDSSSVPLQLLCANGKLTKKVVLSVVRPLQVNKAPPFYSVTLEDVTVVSAGMSGAGSQIQESYTFKFGKIQWQFISYNGQGVPVSTNTSGWSITDGKEL